MIILNTNLEQTISVIPKSYDDNNSYELYFQEEVTKYQNIPEILSMDLVKDLLVINFYQNGFLASGLFFNFYILNNTTNKIVYKDRVFCTNNDNQNYTFPNIDNNSYITI